MSAAVAARAPEVGQHHPAIELAARKLVKALEYATDVLVPLGIAVRERAGKNKLLCCVQKLLQLRNGAQLGLIHVDHHPRLIKHASVQQ